MINLYLIIQSLFGFPVAADIYYECRICGDTVPSRPENSAACSCRNIVVDADAGRISVKKKNKLLIYRNA